MKHLINRVPKECRLAIFQIGIRKIIALPILAGALAKLMKEIKFSMEHIYVGKETQRASSTGKKL